MPTEFCSFLSCRSFPASCVNALCLYLPHENGMGVVETILLRVLAAQLLRHLHKDGVLSVASEIPCSLSVLPSLGNSRKYLHFTNALRLRKYFLFLFLFLTSFPRVQCVWFLFGGVDGRRCWSLSSSSPLPFCPLLLSHFVIALCQTDVVRGIFSLFCAGSFLAPGASPVFCVVHSEVPCILPALPVSMQQGPDFFFFPFSKFLLLGVKGGTVLWWLAASGSSSVHSTFSGVGNKMTLGPSKSTVLGVRVLPSQVSSLF